MRKAALRVSPGALQGMVDAALSSTVSTHKAPTGPQLPILPTWIASWSAVAIFVTHRLTSLLCRIGISSAASSCWRWLCMAAAPTYSGMSGWVARNRSNSRHTCRHAHSRKGAAAHAAQAALTQQPHSHKCMRPRRAACINTRQRHQAGMRLGLIAVASAPTATPKRASRRLFPTTAAAAISPAPLTSPKSARSWLNQVMNQLRA